MVKKIVFIFSVFYVGIGLLQAQNISGTMRSSAERALAYGNVDVYRGEEKVAAVLTDADGNFDVKLDTGMYRIEVQYAGYEKQIVNARVDDSEAIHFELESDEHYEQPVRSMDHNSAEYSVEEERSRLFSGAKEKAKVSSTPPVERSESATVEKVEGLSLSGSGREARSGVLTAGEINDFRKWELWTDIVKDELHDYQSFWKIEPRRRYMVELTNQNQLPVVDASVQLIHEDGSVLFHSRTDNTGKAELWGGLTIDSTVEANCSARIQYRGKTYHIRRLSPFRTGVNQKAIDVDCKQSATVDIAFAVDATGSMGDEIAFLRKELNDVIFQTKNAHPELTFNFANVFYRDNNEAYVTKKQGFSPVLSKSVDFIAAQNAAGGGDYEEAVEVALDEAINELSWSEEARSRILFLVLDAPPHNSPEIRSKLDALMRQAAAKGIRIVPLVASGINKDAEYLLRCMALATNGTYAFLTDHSGIGGSHIEPTTDEYDVELLNDLMIRVITSYIYLPDCENAVEEDDLEDIVNDEQEEDNEEQLEWTIWPNPTQGVLNIKVDRDIEELFLTDLSGKILERYTAIQANSALRRDLSQYARGIYLVKFNYGDKVYTKKAVLQ
ncbi:MAG: carboxypeptidase regulatory-like domain-containing protein [Bacteroidota bacterium]